MPYKVPFCCLRSGHRTSKTNRKKTSPNFSCKIEILILEIWKIYYWRPLALNYHHNYYYYHIKYLSFIIFILLYYFFRNICNSIVNYCTIVVLLINYSFEFHFYKCYIIYNIIVSLLCTWMYSLCYLIITYNFPSFLI